MKIILIALVLAAIAFVAKEPVEKLVKALQDKFLQYLIISYIELSILAIINIAAAPF